MPPRKQSAKEKFNDGLERFLESDDPTITAARFILAVAACGGLLFIGAALPGIMKMVRLFEKSERYSDKQLKNAIQNLKSRKLIRVIEEKNGRSRVELTINGEKKIKEFDIMSLKITKPETWDSKWRVFIFDIPAEKKHKKARDAMRLKIRQLGLKRVQHSVWIHPFPCEEELLFVAENYGVQKFIEIMTVEKLLHEDVIKKKFSQLI